MQMTKESVEEILGFSNKPERGGMVHSEHAVNDHGLMDKSRHTPEFGTFAKDPVSPSFPDPFASRPSLAGPILTAFDPRHERSSHFVAAVVPV
jgi:hypothetical protein